MLKTYPSLDDILSRDRQTVARGATLKTEGDESHARYYVLDGWLAAAKSLEDGDRQILDFVLPGESFDPTGADGRTSFVSIEALCAATVVTIDKADWARLLHADADLQRCEHLRAIAAQARQSERMLRLGRASAETRIAYALIELCLRLSGAHGARSCVFHVPLGQQHLGDFTGLSSVHVCRTLRRLGRLGTLTTDDHMDIRIHDLPDLADRAGVNIATLRAEIIPGAG